MTCNEIRDQMIDYLYGELPAEGRRDFEAHLPGCADCAREVKSMQATLARTRTALRAADEAPPPRVRAAVLAAAGRAAAMTAAKSPEKRPLLEWLRRPWFLPAFAAASIMAVFVLGRQVLTRPHDRVREYVAAPPTVEAPPPEPARVALPKASGPSLDVAPSRRPAKKSAPARQVLSERFDEETRFVPAPTALRLEKRKAELKVDDRMVGDRAAESEQAPAPNAAAPAPAAADSPPPAAPPRAAPAHNLRAKVASESAAENYGGAGLSRGGAVGSLGGASLDLVALVRRADQAFTQERWSEAAADYRELLRRFPGAPQAKSWRTRLKSSEEALAR
jgi:hypothetical protein